MAETRDPYLYLTDSIFQEVGELETYFLNQRIEGGHIRQSGLMRYASLPSVLTARGIEQCANQCTVLTNQRVGNQERGGWSHIQNSRPKLLFPINPAVGSSHVKDGLVLYEVTPEMFVTNEVYPYGFIHGHPGNEPLSVTDISLVTGSHQEVNALACLAGARRFNSLLLATQETINESPEEMTKRFISLYPGLKEEGMSLAERDWDIVFGDEKGEAGDLVLDVLNGNAQSYYADLALIQEAAQYYKFGFYISNRDGIYMLQTKKRIFELVNSVLDEAQSLV